MIRDDSPTVELPELERLDLPRWLPGDRVHERSARYWTVRYYLPDGRPIVGDPHEVVSTYWAVRTARGSHHRRVFFRAGVSILVSTVYVGIDLGSGGEGPAIIWETMVCVGGHWRSEFSARYATATAALHGHRMVCDAIRRSQRARRVEQRLNAPRHAKPFLTQFDVQAWAGKHDGSALASARLRYRLGL